MWNISQIMSIKQYKLAELLGIDQSGVSRLENNRVIQGRCITENSKYIEYLSQILQKLEENPQSVTFEKNTYDLEIVIIIERL